ncbi:MAG TPA: M23 family metallopeptidase [Gemmatimonadaceae bacterium]|jgi:murein DD-endopeptidase MepM/ murein hydrolase activator NlpD
MRTHGLLGAAAAAVLTLITPEILSAQQPRLSLEPARPSSGTLVRVTLDRVAKAGDTVVSANGTMGEDPLHFKAAGNGKFQSLGAIPLDVSDSLVAAVQIVRQSGATDTARLTLKYAHRGVVVQQGATSSRGRAAGSSKLKVDARFTKANAENDARVDEENALAKDVGRRAQNTPQLWTLPFLRPRDTRVTSQYGSGRLFNGRVSSSHLGIDFRGKTGEPIFAANRGIVALVSQFFLAGNVVYIDHGMGVVTGYFHMSQPEVVVGDTVERGQEIGQVGATGRVTGPHLHWSARFGSSTIDPGALFGLKAPFVLPDTAQQRKSVANIAPTTKKKRRSGN